MRQIFVGRWIKGFGRVMQYFTQQMGKTEEERRREKILFFWKKYELSATKDAICKWRNTLPSLGKEKTSFLLKKVQDVVDAYNLLIFY